MGDITGDFVSNSAFSSGFYAYGGAIYNAANATMGTITGNFVNNSASSSNYSSYSGAIYNAGSASIGNITGIFVNNSAESSKYYAYGGAIYNAGKIDDITSDFINNSASSAYTSHGGAIYNSGKIGNIKGNYINNTAGRGAAIYNVYHGTIDSITGNFIANNGSAIYNDSNYDYILKTQVGGKIGNITANFIDNSDTAIYSSYGTIYNITGDFINNSGGAIYTSGGSIGNITGDFIGNSSQKDGGAIYSSSGSISSIAGDFINNSSISNGGAIYSISSVVDRITGDFIGNSSKKIGGAIYVDYSNIISVTGNFINNSSEGYAGAAYLRYSVNNVEGNFIGNHSKDFAGALYTIGAENIKGKFIRNTADTSAGAFYVSVGGHVSGDFIENTAGYMGGAIVGDPDSVTGNFIRNKVLGTSPTNSYGETSSGGAIYITRSSKISGTFVENAVISENYSAYGGAIYNCAYAVINGLDGEFTGNYAFSQNGNAYGGAIYNDGGSSRIKDMAANFVGNHAESINGAAYGGAIYNLGILDEINQITFSKNYAKAGGGEMDSYEYNSDSLSAVINGIYADNQVYDVQVITAIATNSETGETVTFYLFSVNGNIVSVDDVETVIAAGGQVNISTSTDTYTASPEEWDGIMSSMQEGLESGYFTTEKPEFEAKPLDIPRFFAYGGAIANLNTDLSVVNSSFTENSATTAGGAIYNYLGKNSYGRDENSYSTLKVDKTLFKDNTSGFYGGAIADVADKLFYIGGGYAEVGSLASANDFTEGGNVVSRVKITYSQFENNKSTLGGAIASVQNQVNCLFSQSWEVASLSDGISTHDYEGYDLISAIPNLGSVSIDKSNFVNNTAVQGGGIYLNKHIYTVKGAYGGWGEDYALSPNSGIALMDEGFGVASMDESPIMPQDNNGYIVLNNDNPQRVDELIIKNSTFINNTAKNNSKTQAQGGAIHTNANTRIIADKGNTIFQNNKVINNGKQTLNDIYVVSNRNIVTGTSSGNNSEPLGLSEEELTTLTLDARNGGTISFTGTIDGEATETNAIYVDDYSRSKIIVTDVTKLTDQEAAYNLDITGDGTGQVVFGNSVNNANITTYDGSNTYLAKDSNWNNNILTLNGGTISMLNNQVGISDLKRMLVTNDTNFIADVDLLNQKMDRFVTNDYSEHIGNLKVIGMNILSDAPQDRNKTEIFFAEKGLKDNVINALGNLPQSQYQNYELYTPIYKYRVSYDNREDGGYFLFDRGGSNLAGSTSNPSDAFNPAVLSAPVANVAAAQATVNETFKYVFEHADAFTQLPQMERLSKIEANKYALSTDYNENLDLHNHGSLCLDHNNQAAWVRPYTTFESMNLKNGPKVDGITYGTLVGYDGDFKEMKKGWHRIGTGYIGYNGSQLSYSNNDTSMNGGMIGLTETFYKGNFWTALTASAGASVGETTTMYGKEDFTSLLAGIGSKTGYNFEFKEGKFIVQPVMFLSYTFVNTFDYTNAAGVKIDTDPSHSIQLNPSVRFISNLKNGWQPYASVGMVWNVMHNSNVTANGVKLPEMTQKPYVEYGVGVQRNWKDEFTAFGQAMVRNGGRNGVALTAGFRWALGKKAEHTEKVYKPVKKVIKKAGL